MRQSLSENRVTYYRPPEPTTGAGAGQPARCCWRSRCRPSSWSWRSSTRPAAAASPNTPPPYAPYGKRPDPSLLYGLVYTVAAVGALLWLLVLRAVQSRGRSAPILAVVVTTVTAALALLLFVSREYGAPIFPPLWGILAILPTAAGILGRAAQVRSNGSG